MNRKRIRQATIMLAGALLIWASSNVSAANKWYTARTVNGRTQPVSAGTETITMPDGRKVGVKAATVSGGLIDLVISLYNDPKGDDNGNTQDVDAESASQDAYEKIIQYFADGVYEATDGAHSLRNVRIYRGGLRQDADVTWEASGHPGAWYMNQQGIEATIHMYDIFGATIFTNAANHESGGYTLAHEFGHYFYGLLDEYCRWDNGWVGLAANEKTRPCIMNHQWSAAGRVYTWLNHSIRYDTNSLVYVDYECRSRTAQYQHYNDGAWVILSRNPTGDPLDTPRRQWLRTNRGMRMYYPELAAVAPSGMNAPRIDLSAATPLKDLASRDNLNIIWMGSNVLVEIIIDESGSMDSDGKLGSAKAAAKLLVEQIPDRSAVGVIGFDDSVYTISPITVVTSATMRASIKTAIDNSSGGGWTAIGDAALEGLSQMQAFGGSNFTRVAFLLSDGQSNEGTDPLSAAASYQSAQIPIMTFGFGDISDIDSRLLTMAGMTGGKYYYSPSSLSQIAAAFQDAFASISARQNLADGIYMASATPVKGANTVSILFSVDSTIADLDVSVGYATSNTVALTLTAPGGAIYSPTSTNQTGNEKVVSFSVNSPVVGQWTIGGTASSGSSLRYQVNAGVNGFTYDLSAVSLGGDTVAYPDPIEIMARINRGAAVNGAVVKAIITDQDNNTTELPLVNTDIGSYSGTFMPTNDSVYTIVINADNSAGTAVMTWTDILPSATPDGDIGSVTPDTVVTDSFTRTESVQVTVTGTGYASKPSVPYSVTASDGDYPGYVGVTWNAVSGATVYEIWRSTSDSIGSASKVGEIDRSFTSYMDDTVSIPNRYYYWVRGVNFVSAGDFSSSDKGWPMFGPNIRANNASSVTVYSGDNVNVAVRLKVGGYAGAVCDWFIIVMAQNGALYYMNGYGQWVQAGSVNSIRAVATLGLFDIDDPYTIFRSSGLPPGTYKFFFALDANPNGYLDPYCTYYDMSTVHVY